jgi:alcohol dehydrogenase class IV
MSRQKEYAFEMAASSIRFGPGVTKEVGMDFKNMGAKRVCVVTDSVVKNLDAMKQVIEGLTREGVEFTVFDGCRVEPKDSSWATPRLVFKHANVAKIELKRLLISLNLTSQMHFLQLVAGRSSTQPSS